MVEFDLIRRLKEDFPGCVLDVPGNVTHPRHISLFTHTNEYFFQISDEEILLRWAGEGVVPDHGNTAKLCSFSSVNEKEYQQIRELLPDEFINLTISSELRYDVTDAASEIGLFDIINHPSRHVLYYSERRAISESFINGMFIFDIGGLVAVISSLDEDAQEFTIHSMIFHPEFTNKGFGRCLLCTIATDLDWSMSKKAPKYIADGAFELMGQGDGASIKSNQFTAALHNTQDSILSPFFVHTYGSHHF